MASTASIRRRAFLEIAVRLLVCGLFVAGYSWGAGAKVSLKPRPKRPEQAGVRSRGTTIKVDVPLVLVNVTVNDPMNRIITGLQRGHFSVREDKIEQEITHFGEEDAPVSVGIIFDTSGSVGDKMAKCREAVAQFIKISNPQDEYFLIQSNHHAELLIPFTRDYKEILNHLIFTQSKGRTALLDAIYLGIREMEGASHTKKAMLIFSDGGDNSSRYTQREIKNVVREADLQIYALGIFEPHSSRGRTPEELGGPHLLTEIAELTGGRLFAVENVRYLPDIAAKIALELRNQYVLGYVPTNQEKNAKWRRIRIKVKKVRGMPPLHVYARQGYYGR